MMLLSLLLLLLEKTVKVNIVQPRGKYVTGSFFFFFNKMSIGKTSTSSPPSAALRHRPSDDAVLQQRLEVLEGDGGRGLLVAARERGHGGDGLLAVGVGLGAEGQLGGRGGAGGLLRDEQSHQEGHHHRARPQQEGRAGDECSLREARRKKNVSLKETYLFFFFFFFYKLKAFPGVSKSFL